MKKEYEIRGKITENEIRKKIKKEYEAVRLTCPQCARRLTMTMSDPVILYDQYARFNEVEYVLRYSCLVCTPHPFVKVVTEFHRSVRKDTNNI